MPIHKKSVSSKRASAKFVIGRERFTQFSAVEGIKPSAAIKKRTATFEKQGLSGAADDPYCYPGTTVLKNKLGLTKQADLEEFEAEITLQRSAEPLPEGKLSYSHYRAIHRHLFQDVDTAGYEQAYPKCPAVHVSRSSIRSRD